MYELNFFSHTGTSWLVGRYDTKAETREAIKRKHKQAKQRGQTVIRYDRHSWEYTEPENCAMIPDYAGILSVKRIMTL